MGRRIFLTLAAFQAVLGCRTSGAVVQGQAVGGIGDDVCALMLEYDLTVVDTEGQPLPEVELWRVDRFHIQGKAFRIGTADASGHLVALDCYMGSLEFRFWHPETDPVRLHLMLLREGFGLKQIRLAPPTDEVLEAGNVLGVPPGEWFEWSQIKPTVGRRAYRVVTTAALERARH